MCLGGGGGYRQLIAQEMSTNLFDNLQQMSFVLVSLMINERLSKCELFMHFKIELTAFYALFKVYRLSPTYFFWYKMSIDFLISMQRAHFRHHLESG